MSVVLDANIFIRGMRGGIYYSIIEKIIKKGDIIKMTKKIIKEYTGASKMFVRSLLRRIKELEDIRIIKIIGQRKIDAKIKRIKSKRKMRLPSHSKDVKYIYLAWVERVKCIISNNGHLRDLHPYSFQSIGFDIIGPEEY